MSWIHECAKLAETMNPSETVMYEGLFLSKTDRGWRLSCESTKHEPNVEHMRMLLEAVRDRRLSGNSGEGRKLIEACLEGDPAAGYYPKFEYGRFIWE